MTDKQKRAKRMEAEARANANIALAKYWGKADIALNLPAVPSLSLTLKGLETITRVRFEEGRAGDAITLDGRAATAKEAARVTKLLDQVRAKARLPFGAVVVTENRFPTAAGLASSASGFAALAAAAHHAAGLGDKPKVISAIARQASASAARSVYGGFVKLPAGKPGQATLSARQTFAEDHWDVRIVVAETVRGPKKVGSTEGMERSRRTSPFYASWVEAAPALCRRIERAVKARDLDALGPAMEQSTWAFHACAMASDPGIVYPAPATLRAIDAVKTMREDGLSVWATMDAGPHVKALCAAKDARRVAARLSRVEGVTKTRTCRPGPGVRVKA